MATRIGACATARTTAGFAALALTATLAACTGGGSASSAASASSTHDVPSGKQLSTILLAAADLPHDFTEESIGAQNSGANLSAAASSVDLSSADCNKVLNLVNTVGQNSLGEASYASGATQSASVKVIPGPRVGDESVGFTVKVAIGNQTMVMNGAAIRVGTAVAVIDNSLLQGQSTEIDLAKLAGVLVPRLKSLH